MALLRAAGSASALVLVPGLSFLDLAWLRLGVDPLAAGPVEEAPGPSTGRPSRPPCRPARCW